MDTKNFQIKNRSGETMMFAESQSKDEVKRYLTDKGVPEQNYQIEEMQEDSDVFKQEAVNKLVREWMRLGYSESQAKEMAARESDVKPERPELNHLQEQLKKEWEKLGYNEEQAREMAERDGGIPHIKIPSNQNESGGKSTYLKD